MSRTRTQVGRMKIARILLFVSFALALSGRAAMAIEACNGCDPVTDSAIHQKIVAERAQDARRIATESSSRPWTGAKQRELYGLPPDSQIVGKAPSEVKSGAPN
jgi:hypothetical protein